ncbi:MAG: FkbM family methyltransferase [Rhodocyclaceae bacterium]|nr:FkbM family methyltransferase [Rhodocyclaceae bacterium]
MSLIGTIVNQPLNRDKKLKSISRFFKWQISSRLAPGAIIFEWVNGSKFKVKSGETGLTGNIYAGLHEFPDMAFLLHFLRPGDFFVDVGANVGSYTILACAAIGAKGCAFEPVLSTYERLVENVRLNHLEDKVQCINKGVGAKNGTLSFTSQVDTMNHALAQGEESENSIIVELVSLDDSLGGGAPELMKVDVEGFETNVLNGAGKTLSNKRLRCVIMELNGCGSRYGFDESKILKSMAEFGFKTYSYDAFSRQLINLGGKNHKSSNTLFIRDELFVIDRLRRAPKVSLLDKQF